MGWEMAAFSFSTSGRAGQQQSLPAPAPEVSRRANGQWYSGPQLAPPPAALPRPRGAAAAAAASHEPPPAQAQAAPAWAVPAARARAGDTRAAEAIRRGLEFEGGDSAPAQALLTAHYSAHGAFLLDDPLLDPLSLAPLRDRVICLAVQGGADLVCPPATAFELSEAWPEAEVAIVAGAGHSMYDPAITHELVSATNRLRALDVVG